MTIGEFVYNREFNVYGRIVVYGHTENDVCHETHKVYDSCHPRFQGHAIPDNIQKITFRSVCPADDGISIHYTTNELIYDFL